MPSDQISIQPGDRGNANLIYILYLVGLVVGITPIIGVIMAYIARGDADGVLRSHYDNQINIFWKWILYVVISFVLTVVLIGFLLLLGVLIWYIVRVIKGMQTLGRGEAYPNPASWGF